MRNANLGNTSGGKKPADPGPIIEFALTLIVSSVRTKCVPFRPGRSAVVSLRPSSHATRITRNGTGGRSRRRRFRHRRRRCRRPMAARKAVIRIPPAVDPYRPLSITREVIKSGYIARETRRRRSCDVVINARGVKQPRADFT